MAKQHRSFTIEVLHQLIWMYQEGLESNDNDLSRWKLSSCMFLFFIFLGRMRGYENVSAHSGGLL